ncbi:hypothetical protein GGI12_001050 [Dipsacomyces acuminosporus]|nr:hypothetical protein GGI12_001050 [Dipsacomyces acuminosporus]
MVRISDDESDNMPLIQSMRELTGAEASSSMADDEGEAAAPPKLEHPSISRIVRAGPKLGPDGKPRYLIDDIPDNEKMRLIRESGILKKYSKTKASGTGSDIDEDETFDDLERIQAEYDQADDIPLWMNALIYSIALAAIYGLFEALVTQQYSVEITALEILQRMAKATPAIYFIVYITYRYRNNRLMNLFMLLLATVAGCYFIHLNLHSPRLGIMRRAPGLVTVWMYLIFMMDVRPSMINVAVVGLFWLLDPFKVVL